MFNSLKLANTPAHAGMYADMGNLLFNGLALGGGLAGILRLKKYLDDAVDSQMDDTPKGPEVINIPYKRKPQLIVKKGEDNANPWWNWLFTPSNIYNKYTIPGYYPSAAITATAAPIAGYMGVNGILGLLDRSSNTNRLSEAKKNYIKALSAQFNPVLEDRVLNKKSAEAIIKNASTDPIEKRIGEKLEKLATTLTDLFNIVGGSATVIPTASFGVGALGAYMARREADPYKDYWKQLKERRRAMKERDEPIYAKLVPVD